MPEAERGGLCPLSTPAPRPGMGSTEPGAPASPHQGGCPCLGMPWAASSLRNQGVLGSQKKGSGELIQPPRHWLLCLTGAPTDRGQGRWHTTLASYAQAVLRGGQPPGPPRRGAGSLENLDKPNRRPRV